MKEPSGGTWAARVGVYGIQNTDQLVGPYRIEAMLGQGGQATVYRAIDTRIGRTVALKVLRRAAGPTTDVLLRFRREAEITSALDHPSICPVFEVGIDHETPFIAMRLVEGKTLAQHISTAKARDTVTGHTSVAFIEVGDDTLTAEVGQKVGGLTNVPPTAAPRPRTPGKPIAGSPSAIGSPNARPEIFDLLRVIESAARALDRAHEAGIVHRDIKPGNIMVQKDGTPIILDFGLAYQEDSAGPSLSMTGEILGTPAYMAPEQIAAKAMRVDRRADIYSLGVTLYECLTLARPFEAPTREALYQAITFKEPAAPRSLNPAIPSDVEVVLLKALEKDPDVRFQTAVEFADELGRIRAFEPITTRRVGALKRHWRWIQRNPGWATAAYGIVIALAIAVAVFSFSNNRLNRANAALEKKTIEAEANAREAKTNAARAAMESHEKGLALESYDRLADTTIFAEAVAEADLLHPVSPALIARIDAWKARYGSLLDRLPIHEATLLALRAKAKPYTDGLRAADYPAEQKEMEILAAKAADLRALAAAAPKNEQLDEDAEEAEDRAKAAKKAYFALPQRGADFGDEKKTQFQYDTLLKLVLAIREFKDPRFGPLDDIERRLRESKTILDRTVTAHAKEWQDAIERIRTNKNYGGLVIRPQVGLVPLGPDKSSTFEEFYDPGTGVAPVRDAEGRIVVTAEMAVVFVLLPGGTFSMGAQNDDPAKPNYSPGIFMNQTPVHTVVLGPYFLSKYEMSQGQWMATTHLSKRGEKLNPSQWTGENYPQFEWCKTDLRRPVESVSWDDAAHRMRELGCQLPTEAQWEFACRAGTGGPFSFDSDPKDLGLYANVADKSLKLRFDNGVFDAEVDDGFPATSPIGAKRPNAFGLHDMHGNVCEWCADVHIDYKDARHRPGDGLIERAGITARTTRGGSFYDLARYTYSAARNGHDPQGRLYNLGCRPARALAAE